MKRKELAAHSSDFSTSGTGSWSTQNNLWIACQKASFQCQGQYLPHIQRFKIFTGICRVNDNRLL